SRKYDTRTTTFSPEEKRNYNELLDDMGSEKIYKISNDICCCVAGVSSDANVIIQMMRERAQSFYKTYQEPIHLEQLVTAVCDVKQQYTQLGGYRPFGVSILYIGWDNVYGYQLYQSDPSGNYSGWNATCVGLNNNKALLKLKQDYKEMITVEESKGIILKIMQEALETDYISSKNMEIAIFKRENDKSIIHILSPEEILALP
ncbi:proteasome subunit alpha type-4-like, partial [Pempheris klunzingeri]|uniref:proteasome subunit alpha type-4-like n=1 Tax=Pempheris klunzingeri TaxID=3127111 RepID=UPI00397F4AA2